MRRYLAVLILLAGCDLYFGGGGDDTPCPDYGWAQGEGQGAALELRNPNTGECESFGGGYGCDYDRPECGPCPLAGGAALTIANPDWGYCYGQCSGLDEDSCLTTSGCQAAYDEDGRLDAPSMTTTTFKGCWDVAQSGPVQGGGCYALDAYECSRHDDCSIYYDNQYGPDDGIVGTKFSRCGPEPTTQGCSAVDCGPGYRCEEQCYACDGVDGPCDPFCSPMCVPEGQTCLATDCAPGYTCVETCDTMSPTAGALPPGQCYPQCVPDTACEALPNEAACSGRSDCMPVYLGDDCTCYPGYCDCQILTYDRCEPWGAFPL